jgi:NADH-quinone oxidoreductase subunit F
MQKFATFKEFVEVQQSLQPLLDLRRDEAQEMTGKRELLICGDTGCRLTKSQEVLAALREEIAAAGLDRTAQAHLTGCFGFCEKGPIIKVFPDNIVYFEVRPEDAQEIVSSHLKNNTVVKRLLYQDPAAPGHHLHFTHQMDFYKKQKQIALRNLGRINPRDISEYIAADGYLALGKCLDSMKPEDVVRAMIASGLRGRGGGGFPTGLKWQAAAGQKAGKKYIVCNGDEGDPGAFMDRSIMEGDPHSILEAMAIGAYAIGADQGYVYIRAEYPLAISSLQLAIRQATEMGLLGENILKTDFSFSVEVKYGAGAFVCGEETALLHSIEGARGEPTFKPPFPAEKGLYGKPTVINNVETLASIPPILLKGAEWFSGIGTEKSKGTKVFALAGKINNVGLVEVPMGISLREIIYEIGGGIKNGKRFKAVQTGGPSGGCIGPNYLDIKIDYESLGVIGSMMGSGGMIVMDEDNCMVDIARFYLDFIMDESCGKCTPCRIGSKRLHELLCDITEGRGTMQHLEKLENLGKVMQDTALCGLGQTAPNPVLSTLRHFRDEYIAHVQEKRCPAKVCRQLLDFIITDACIDCGRCIHECPVHAIEGVKRQYHSIDKTRCIKCGRCESVCPVKAIVRG